MSSIREHVNYWRHRRTVEQFSGAHAQTALVAAARRAFRDSEYESSLGAAFSLFLLRGCVSKMFLLAYTRWLDMLGRNDEALPILERVLESVANAQLANQLAWVIADVAPATRFGENARWLSLAAEDPSAAVCIEDTRGWMAYRVGDLEAALQHLSPLAASIVTFPDIGYHLAVVAYAAGRQDEAAAYLDQALFADCPFGRIYDAMRLRSRLLQEASSSVQTDEDLELPIATIKTFSTTERHLVVSLNDGHVISLTWDRIWELADATDEQRQTCYVTEDRLGLVWPEPVLALTSLHLREAAMKGNVPPEYRPLYGRYPKSWLENGVKVDTSKFNRDIAGYWP
jgi:tetratricopeptide (TPR) repeat protein